MTLQIHTAAMVMMRASTKATELSTVQPLFSSSKKVFLPCEPEHDLELSLNTASVVGLGILEQWLVLLCMFAHIKVK